MNRSNAASHLGTQVCRNVIVAGRRTSIRMEQVYWGELQRICTMERKHLHEIITMVDLRRSHTNLTAALRVFVICYMQQQGDGPGIPHRSDGSFFESVGAAAVADMSRLRSGVMGKALDVVGPPSDQPGA